MLIDSLTVFWLSAILSADWCLIRACYVFTVSTAAVDFATKPVTSDNCQLLTRNFLMTNDFENYRETVEQKNKAVWLTSASCDKNNVYTYNNQCIYNAALSCTVSKILTLSVALFREPDTHWGLLSLCSSTDWSTSIANESNQLVNKNQFVYVNRWVQTWWSRHAVQQRSAAHWRLQRLNLHHRSLTTTADRSSTQSTSLTTMTSRYHGDRSSTTAASVLRTRSSRRRRFAATWRRRSTQERVSNWH